MSEDAKGFDVRAVWRLSLSVWARHLIVFVALSSLSYFFLHLLRGAKGASAWLLPEAAPWMAAGVFLLLVLVWIAVQGFVVLLIIDHFRCFSRGARPVFSEIFVEARRSWGRYVLSVILLLGLALFGLTLAVALLEAGRMLYVADQTNVTGLVATHLAAVIFIIAMAWYGFYFSLGPLVAAYEAKGPFAAFRESRRRIRGQALGYMLALTLFIFGYIAVGLSAYFGVIRLGGGNAALSWVDPAMLMLFSPLWLAVWYASYEHLTRLKTETKRPGL